MSLLMQIAEQRILEAVQKGELDDLPNAGQPLDFSFEEQVPPELRMGYRILKNAGYIPAELQLYKDIVCVEQLIQQATAVEERSELNRRLQYLMIKLQAHGTALSEQVYQRYRARLSEALAGSEQKTGT